MVPTSVEDLAGNALSREASATVSLAALMSATLELQSNLTGNVQEGSTTYYSFFFGGDSSANAVNYGAISFPLAGPPQFENVLGIYSATYATQVISMAGNPNDPALSGFVVDHVEFAAGSQISSATVLESAFFDVLAAGAVQAGDPVVVDVLPQLENSWSGDASHLQLRFHHGQPSANAVADRIFLRRAGDENNGIVAAGVADPDTGNRSRVEIEYFTL